MDARFAGKRALVTGGGRGIGREIARYLVKCGAKTIVLTKSDSSVSDLKEDDPDIEAVQVDLVDWDNTKRAVQALLPVDLLVNNAAILILKPFLVTEEKDIDAVFELNYKAAFNISQIVCADLIRRGKPGSIVNVSGLSSIKRFSSISAFGPFKSAFDSLTKYMALEMGPKQIRVNSVLPTGVKTDMVTEILDDADAMKKYTADIPLGRFAEKSEVAEAVLFLLSDRASFINGVNLPIDGGHSL